MRVAGGEFDRPRDPAAHDLADDASDLEEMRRHLGRERVDLLGGSTAREIAAALPAAELVVFSGADHFPFLEPDSRAA